ncbi:MAG: hypothetical protein AABZ55_03415 [Bdellovibrionota bacterium]
MKTNLIFVLAIGFGVLAAVSVSESKADQSSGCTGFNCQPQSPAPPPSNPGCTGANCQPQFPSPPNGGQCYPYGCTPDSPLSNLPTTQPPSSLTPIYVSIENGRYRVPLTKYTYFYSNNFLLNHGMQVSPTVLEKWVLECIVTTLEENFENSYYRNFLGNRRELENFHSCLLEIK